MSEEKAGGGEPGGAARGAALWPLWKKVAFSVAALCLTAGVGLRAYADLSPRPTRVHGSDQTRTVFGGAPSSGAAHLLQTGLVAGGTGGETASGAGGQSDAATGAPAQAGPILTQSGLAFFAAFCVGAALRFIARTAVIVLGCVLLVVIGLSAAGVIPPVNWSSLEGPFRSTMEVLQTAVGKIEGALTHALPSGTMAGLGLAAGLKKGV